MTKNKARKTAIRARAAETGERYVVARRAIEHEPDTTGSRAVLHRLTHRVPGVPAHVEGGLVVTRNRPHRPSARVQRHHGQPRVLIGWQNRIARLVGAK